MRTLKKIFLLSSLLGIAACGKPAGQAVDLKAAFVGQWKVTDATGGSYLMTLNSDGSGKTTRGAGEFGKWQFLSDHIEAEWFPTDLKIYHDSGQVKPLNFGLAPTAPDAPASTAVKLEGQ